MSLPNFFIAGAPRAGTTSLYNYLLQHPQIYLSKVKEPHYFAFKEQPSFTGPEDLSVLNSYYVSNREEYKKLFLTGSTYKAIGEASAQYLYSNVAAKKIKEEIPDAKFIIILRNPVDRAYSHYLRMLSHGRENIQDFEKALEAEPERVANNWSWAWHYRGVSLYSDQIKRYLDEFSLDKLKIIEFKSFKENTEKTLDEICQFLEVSNFNFESLKHYNKSGVFPTNWLRRITSHKGVRLVGKQLPTSMKKFIKNHFYKKPKLSIKDRQRITEKYFRDDLLKLQEMLDTDFSDWLLKS